MSWVVWVGLYFFLGLFYLIMVRFKLIERLPAVIAPLLHLLSCLYSPGEECIDGETSESIMNYNEESCNLFVVDLIILCFGGMIFVYDAAITVVFSLLYVIFLIISFSTSYSLRKKNQIRASV